MSKPPTGLIQPAFLATAGTLPPNTAIPPPEVYDTLGEYGLSRDEVDAMGWYAHPRLVPLSAEPGVGDPSSMASVDAQLLMEPLLDRPELTRTLRIMDVLNGCFNQCDTCCVDAPLPTSIFSYDSLARLFDDRRFVRMLQGDSFRIGSVGDLLDHPQGVEIARMIGEVVKRAEIGRLKVFANYRSSKEGRFDDLFELVWGDPQLFRVVISLPLNRDDNVKRAFKEYLERRERLSIELIGLGPDDSIDVHDVGRPFYLIMQGRMLPESILKGRVNKSALWYPGDKRHIRAQRGFVKTLLNPDALWLKIYSTPKESHTASVYTPVTAQTISTLSYLHYHPDFQPPPNWPGGIGKR